MMTPHMEPNMDETRNEAQREEQVEAWLVEHLPSAVTAYRLWRANSACVEIAHRRAKGMQRAHGDMLVAANIQARFLSWTEYAGALGVAIDHAALALTAAGCTPQREAALTERISTLRALFTRGDEQEATDGGPVALP